MEKFWEKFDQYLFDIVGILFPGAFGLLMFIFLSHWNLKHFQELTPNLFPKLDLVIFFIGCFLFGHTIKHCSVTFYRCFTAWLDEGIYKAIRDLWQTLLRFEHKLMKIPRKFIWLRVSLLYKLLRKVYKCRVRFFEPLWAVLYNDLLKFSTTPYSKRKYGNIEAFVVKKLSVHPELNFTASGLTDGKMMKDEIYKISTIISHNENIKSLGNVHLAKYNCYRSLVFIFLSLYFTAAQ